MDELLCNQARAYGAGATDEGDLSAVRLYEQLKEAIESIEKTVADDELLRTMWYDPAGKPVEVKHIGYYNQSFIVFCGKEDDGGECTALVPAHSAQLILKKVKKQLREEQSSISFIGHSVVPDLMTTAPSS